MLKIKRDAAAEWQTVFGPFEVLLAPLDFYTWQVLQFRVDRATVEETETRALTPDEITALRGAIEVREMARELIRDWRGLADAETGEAILFDAALTAEVAKHPLLAPRLRAMILEPILTVLAEGEGCGAAPSGSLAAAPSTADDAPTAESAAPTAAG